MLVRIIITTTTTKRNIITITIIIIMVIPQGTDTTRAPSTALVNKKCKWVKSPYN